jgi:hypothetical protein
VCVCVCVLEFTILCMNKQKKEFLIRNPELAVIDIEVLDEDVTTFEFIGYAALPVSCMKPGTHTHMYTH